MKSPITGKNMPLKAEKKTMSFRKEDFEIVYRYYYCAASDSQFTTTELDELNTIQVYHLYRQNHGLPFPEDIKRIREKYGLSQRKMSQVLGLGINTYGAYEKGEVPSDSIGNLIQLADDPKTFERLVIQSPVLEKKSKEKLLQKVKKVVKAEKERKFESKFQEYLFLEEEPEEYSGFRRPSMPRLMEMVTYFAHELQPWKTQLNKLLFYADFETYRKTGYSMSGTRYRAIPYGPVPYKYQSLFEYMIDKDVVNINYQEFSNGEGEKFIPSPKKSFDAELFSEEELTILSRVAETFKDTRTQDLIDISHRERGWQKNKDKNQLINYKYAFYLKGV